MIEKIDDFDKNCIRRIFHSFFLSNEIPTISIVLEKVNADVSQPKYKRSTFYSILKLLDFKFKKRCRNSILIEKEEIVEWRRRYLRQIRTYRSEGRKIYYTDETWINGGHTKSNVWHDITVLIKQNAFLRGLSTGLKNPAGKGQRLIITHIGSEDGFVEGGLLSFQSRSTADYHEEMKSGLKAFCHF